MPWKTEFNATCGAVEVVLSGEVTHTDLEESTTSGFALACDKATQWFLIDSRQVTAFASLAQFYELAAKRYGQLGVPRQARAALVPAQDEGSQKNAQFYEDACRNRGWNVKVFKDRQSALAWLCRPQKA